MVKVEVNHKFLHTLIWGLIMRPSEKAMAPHSSIPVWKIPWTEELGGLQFMGRRELDMTEVT